jgi:hypothetical protein
VNFALIPKRLFLPARIRQRKILTNNIWHGWSAYYSCVVRATGNVLRESLCQIVTLSIGVGSSSGARELLTRFETGPSMSRHSSQVDSKQAAPVNVMNAAIAARHGGVLPKTLSDEDAKVASKAAIKWQAKH